VIEELITFCNLLAMPENHVKVPSRHYVEKQVQVRQVADMTDETAHDLANLPRYTAYARVIKEKDGQQTVERKKIKTLPMPDVPPPEKLAEKEKIVNQAIQTTCTLYCKKREDIEDRLCRIQDFWRLGTTGGKPPSHED